MAGVLMQQQMMIPVLDDVNEEQMRLEEFDDPWFGTDSYVAPLAFETGE